MGGYFKLHRELFEKPIWVNSTLEQQIILINLLGMANWQSSQQEVDGEIITLAPGQFIASVEDIRKRINNPAITTKKIRGANERFRKLGFLANVRASTRANAKSIITIVNWRLYQCENINEGKQEGEREGNERANEKPFEGKLLIYKNYKEIEEINNNACAHEQTNLQEQVNEKGNTADQHAGRVERCMNYYQSAIHAFFSTTERDCIEELAREYDEAAFVTAVDKAKEKGVNHTGAWKYIAAILKNGGIKDFPKGKSGSDKNDIAGGAARAMELLKGGGIIDL